MNLRDYFAGAVAGHLMVAMLTDDEVAEEATMTLNKQQVTPEQLCAITAYRLADALIAESEKGKQ